MWPGPQMTAGSRVVEQRGLGAEGRPCASCARRCTRGRLGDRVAAVVVEARAASTVLELDARLRDRPRASPAGASPRGVATSAKNASGIVERQMADLEFERAIARHDIERGTAADDADVAVS